MLQVSFGVGNKGNVVSKEEVMEQLLKCFCVGMQSPEVKQTAVKMVADVYSTFIIKVFYDLFKHHAEKDAQRSQCQDTTLFHVVDDGEGSKEVTVQPKMAVLAFVLLDNHAEELCGEAKVHHDHPPSLSAHCVKFFGQVHKHYIQSFDLLSAFLLEMSEDEHHVCGTPVGSESTLGFWWMLFSDGGYQSV